MLIRAVPKRVHKKVEAPCRNACIGPFPKRVHKKVEAPCRNAYMYVLFLNGVSRQWLPYVHAYVPTLGLALIPASCHSRDM